MSAGYRLRTIDVWDTLIRRRCHPECIKLSLAQHVHLRFGARLPAAFQDPHKLYLERLAVETALAGQARAAGRDDEYELEGVLAQWLLRLAPADAWPAGLATELAEVELRLECERSYPDPDIGAVLAQHPAENSIFLSDFYMGAERLGRLLAHHGLTPLAGAGISSCDVGLNKRSGRLFSHVHAAFGVAPSAHVHIGDNGHSDVAMPAQLGVRAVSFLPEEGQRLRHQREQLFASRAELFSFVRERSVAAAERGLADGTLAGGAAFLAGVQAAPLFLGFALFTAERSVADRVEHLYFQTREGEFFLRVHTALFPDGRLAGIDLAPASVLEVSRLATFAASLRACSIDELQRLWRLVQRQSVAALFRTLGLSLEKHAAVLAECGLTADEPIDQPWNDARIARLLGDAGFARDVLDKAAADRALLLAYLAQQGVLEKHKAGLVDIGWRGTIQDNIAGVAGQVGFHGYYLGLQRYLNPQPANAFKSAFGPDANGSLEWSALLDAVAPLEMICNSGNGSVEGYARDGADVTALRRVDGGENRAYDTFSRGFQDGVVFAAQQWQPYLQDYAVAAAELRQAAMATWQALSENSPDALVEACLGAPQNDVFGFGGFLDHSDIPSMGKMLRGAFVAADRRYVIEYIKRSQWPSAIRRRSDIGQWQKRTLLCLLFLARQYKHLRMKYVYLKAGLKARIK